MPMRTDCKHYQSRTYGGGETVRKCALDLAPEAPWRCPAGCTAFEPRLADVDWSHGSLVSPATPDEPPGLDEGAVDLLDEAEDIVNSAVPSVLSDLAEAEGRPRWWERWRKRRGG
jgi:hypothetical protein